MKNLVFIVFYELYVWEEEGEVCFKESHEFTAKRSRNEATVLN